MSGRGPMAQKALKERKLASRELADMRLRQSAYEAHMTNAPKSDDFPAIVSRNMELTLHEQWFLSERERLLGY